MADNARSITQRLRWNAPYPDVSTDPLVPQFAPISGQRDRCCSRLSRSVAPGLGMLKRSRGHTESEEALDAG